MSSALKLAEPPTKRLSRTEQLKVVSEESERIWRRHKSGELSSEEAVRQLAELRRRYMSLFDRILNL